MKKKHYTKEQMLDIYADWQQSGLGKKAYCNQIGLATATFFYWTKKLALQEQDSAAGFAQFNFPIRDNHTAPVLEIEYPSGTRIKFYSQPAANWIKTLL